MQAPQMQTTAGGPSSANTKPDAPNFIAIDTADQVGITHTITKLRLKGHQVIRGPNGDFLCSKWGMSRWCADAVELHAFARKMGVVR